MTVIEAKQYHIVKYAKRCKPINLKADFKLVTRKYDLSDPDLLREGEVLVETIYLSNDPDQKSWFTDAKDMYFPPTSLHKPAPATGIGKVIKTNSPKFNEGEIVESVFGMGWTTHNIISDPYIRFTSAIDATKTSKLSNILSIYGETTLAAYVAAFKKSGITVNDTGRVFLVSAAAGAVGSILVHILANLFKPKTVIGITGSDEKVKYVESLGPNVIGVNHKSSDYREEFSTALGDNEIDVFFDQVGGKILDHAINFIKSHGRIVQSGLVACYNNLSEGELKNYSTVIYKDLTIQGFTITDYVQQEKSIFEELDNYERKGKLDFSKVKEDIIDATGDSFVHVPEIWNSLFSGQNIGKLITRISNEN
ncbi:hypothetical protein WICMUC_004525 [Wickerhamomyces mucosus]|uniref:Enoyl reductase (ER) domain-containing protein n=1 Tax=Wickerhamomyces mucosus TaxID=1378264 RepID=A0A9P8PGV0_9ASCO|nr:hypothetical protein WICMUC_004525 [Wickerhamomyces mucosus]